MTRGKKFSERGIAVAEAAVVTPLLVLILLVTADFGRAFYTYITLASAARAGAQYGGYSLANSTDTAKIQQAAVLEAQDIGAITVSSKQLCLCHNGNKTCKKDECGGYGDAPRYVEVTATHTFKTLFPYPGISNTIPMSRTATIRVE